MKVAFLNANVFDGIDYENIHQNQTVLVDGEKIKYVGEDSAVPSGYEKIDLGGRYLLPGLINLHAHLFGNGRPSKVLGGGSMQKALVWLTGFNFSHPIIDSMVKANAQSALYSGVTTMRTSGDFCYSDVRVRDNIKNGKYPGPRMLVPGPAITCHGGHGDGNFAEVSDDLGELTSFVDQRSSHGVDYIKICVTGGVMDAKVKGGPGEVKMTPEMVSAVCNRAHQLGYKVASHTQSAAGIKVALENGVDSIEHGSFLDDDLVGLFKEKNAIFVVTTSPALPLARLPKEITKLNELAVYNSEVVLQGMISGAKRALAEGIPVGLGTDCACPLVTPYNMWREIDYFSKLYGVSNGFALHTATKVNANLIGLGDLTGSVEEGKAADLLVVSSNPLADVSALREPEMVMANGTLYREPKVQKNEDIETWLDGIDVTKHVNIE